MKITTKLLAIIATTIFFTSCKKEILNLPTLNSEEAVQQKSLGCIVLYNHEKIAQSKKIMVNRKRDPFVPIETVVFIDTAAEWVTSPYWNGGQPFFCQPAGLTASEKSYILRKNQDDLAGQLVTVTYNRNFYNNAVKRVWHIIAKGITPYVGNGSGTAQPYSFFWGIDVPSFSIMDHLHTVDDVASTVSHEVAHTIGADHRADWLNCNLVGLVQPVASPAGLLSITMGNATNSPIAVWDKGTVYAGPWSNCVDTQDVRQLLSDAFGQRLDDIVNYQLTPGIEKSFTREMEGDVDKFKFQQSPSKTLEVTVTSNGNCKFAFRVLINGTLVATVDPANSLGGTYTVPIGSGEVVVEVGNTTLSDFAMLNGAVGSGSIKFQ